MKIKTEIKSYEEVISSPPKKHLRPKKQSLFFRTLLKIASIPELSATKFIVNKIELNRLKRNEPCLIFMNHSSFIDLKIASSLLFPRPFNVVCTYDGFIGKEKLMRNLGCIPTNKFVSDSVLIRDMLYAVKTLKSSVLMYSEATYTFDGSAAPIPNSIGKCVKILGVPVLFIKTYGAFARDPLYNELHKRDVRVSADVRYILSPTEIANKTADEITETIKGLFSFDNFRWQQENKIKICEKFRAEGLERILYKCPHCSTENKMKSKDEFIYCEKCGKKYYLNEYGFLEATEGETKFNHIPDWYMWERECVKNEISDGTYFYESDVEIKIMVNTDSLYSVGDGHIYHNSSGFHLVGCNGKLDYFQKPLSSYSLYSDFYWYEIGDMICIGDNKISYYCFPKNKGGFAAKTRLAVEELYKLCKEDKLKNV